MSKKIIFQLLLLIALPLAVCAQEAAQPQIKFGYFSFNQILKSMDGYIIMQHNISQLRNQYTAEAKRSEDDFNAKYEAFIDEQAGLATNIRNKRQAELMDLMEKNTEFKRQAEKILAETEQASLDSLGTLIDNAARELGNERGLAFILNTDNHSLPFVNPLYSEDVTAALEERLRNK